MILQPRRGSAKILGHSLSCLKWCNVSKELTTFPNHNSPYQKYLKASFANRCWYQGFSHMTQLWQPSLPALVLWGAVTVQVCAPGRSEREVMQPAGILQLKLLLCSTGRLTNSAQQHSTPHLSAYPIRAICSQWVILSSDRPGMNHFCSCLQFTADCWGKWWLLRLDY